MRVILANRGNIDYGQYPGMNIPGKPKDEIVKVKNSEEASKVCREYIEENELGFSTWTGGQVMGDNDDGLIGYVWYNGKVVGPADMPEGLAEGCEDVIKEVMFNVRNRNFKLDDIIKFGEHQVPRFLKGPHNMTYELTIKYKRDGVLMYYDFRDERSDDWYVIEKSEEDCARVMKTKF